MILKTAKMVGSYKLYLSLKERILQNKKVKLQGFFMTQISLGIAGRTLIVLVLSCRGSYYHYFRMIYSPAPESHYIYFLGSRKKSKLKTEQQRNKWKHAFNFNMDEICK